MAGPVPTLGLLVPTLGLLAALLVCGKGGHDPLPGGSLCLPASPTPHGPLLKVMPNSHSHLGLTSGNPLPASRWLPSALP